MRRGRARSRLRAKLEGAISWAGRSSPPLVVVDTENLRFIDMAGLRVLISAHELAEEEGRQLVLANVSGPVRRVLALAQAEELLPALEGG